MCVFSKRIHRFKELSEEGDEVGAVGRTADKKIIGSTLVSIFFGGFSVCGFLRVKTDSKINDRQRLLVLVNYVIYYPDLGLR